MGTLRQVGQRWRAEIMVEGKRASKRFDLKSDAKAWMAAAETEMRQPGHVQAAKITGVQLFAQFVKANDRRKQIDRETLRLAHLNTDPAFALALADITPAAIAGWRDRRLKVVSNATVLRDWNLLSSVFGWAVEHGITATNPFSSVKRPNEPPPRDHLISDDEIARVGLTVGWPVKPNNVKTLTVWAFHFAIETAMRRGEITALEWSDISARTATVRGEAAGGSKSGKRVVPLSFTALALLDLVRHLPKPCPAANQSMDVMWRRIRADAAIVATFHDTRHLAVTRLSKKLDMMALARMTGHKNPAQLQAYYNPDPADLAARLD